MNAKNLLLTLAVGAMVAGCNSGSMNQTSTTLKTEADTASFYIGYMYGTGLERTGIKDPNMSAIVAGMNSAIQKKEMKTDPQEMEMFLNNYMQKLMMMKAEENVKKGAEFLAANLKKSGVDTLAGGVQYKVEKEGTGAKPTENDVVKVHYKGTLIDGTEFDSSVKRGEPLEIQVNRVIPGWTKALQEMPVGSKWTLYIPSNMAYGERGMGGGGPIGPNETLIFEVELLEIMAPEAPEEPIK